MDENFHITHNQSDSMQKLSSGIIEIGGRSWYTRECFLAKFGMKKSNFYNQIKSGNIKSRKLFEHPNTLFYVYAFQEVNVKAEVEAEVEVSND